MPSMTITANGTHRPPKLDYAALRNEGAFLGFHVTSDSSLGGGTLALKACRDGTNFRTLQDLDALEPGDDKKVQHIRGEYAFVLSGATAPSITVEYGVGR